MLFFGHTTGNEDAKMAYGFVDRVDNGLSIGSNVINAVVEIKNPSKRLLRRCYIVAFRAEHNDRRTDIAKVDYFAIRCLDTSGRQIVSDKQLIDDELNFFRV